MMLGLPRRRFHARCVRLHSDILERLQRDGALVPGWSSDEAADLFWTMLSIRNWESLTTERGWATDRYVGRMQELTKRAFVRGSEGA